MALHASLAPTEDSHPLDVSIQTAAALSRRWVQTDQGRATSPESQTTFFHPSSIPSSPASSTCPSPTFPASTVAGFGGGATTTAAAAAAPRRSSPSSTPPPSTTTRPSRHARSPRRPVERRRQRTHPSVSPFAARRSRTAEEWLVSRQDAEWFTALSEKSQDLYLPPRHKSSKSRTHSRHMDSLAATVKPVRQQRPRNFSLPAPYHGPRPSYSSDDREVVQDLPQHRRFASKDDRNASHRPVEQPQPQPQPQPLQASAGNGSKTHIRRSSFRQTLSLTSPRPSISSFARPSMSGFPRPSLFPQRSSWSYSKKVSNKENTRPAATPLGPSEYYQDPEARRKLRVYLGSPQKFEEVLAYGFPSTAQQQEVMAYHLPRPQTARDGRSAVAGEDDFTFLHDDEEVLDIDGEIDGGEVLLDDDDDDDDHEAASLSDHDSPITPTFQRASYTPRPFSETPATKYSRNAPLIPLPSPALTEQPAIAQRPHIFPMITSSPREMTLRMTLTRPDLRADEDQIYRWHHKAATDDIGQQPTDCYPTAFAAFNSAAPAVWDDPVEESGRMRRLLRRMRSGSTRR